MDILTRVLVDGWKRNVAITICARRTNQIACVASTHGWDAVTVSVVPCIVGCEARCRNVEVCVRIHSRGEIVCS